MQPPLKIFKIRQKFAKSSLINLDTEVNGLLDGFELAKKVQKGERIGLTAGSRGIKDEQRIFKVLIERLKTLGASPFIVPCMGSHGGGTAEGQLAVLRDLGITEEATGAPILSSMEVVEIGCTQFGTPILIDKNLSSVDKIIVINRIKPHTHFEGKIEGGLIKMMVIGMGKHRGAQIAHRLAIEHGLPRVLSEMGSIILRKLPIFFGIGIVENQFSETAFIDLLEPMDFFKKEETLLKKARRLIPRLPFHQIDLLIVDELGKDISGAGMDTKVIGRIPSAKKMTLRKPEITRIFVRDLSEGSQGNATGIGLADFTTKRLVDKINYQATYVNCITAVCPADAKIPIFFETDREAILRAYETSAALKQTDFRIVWIKNTSALESFFASTPLLEETVSNPRLEVLSDPFEIPFDNRGNLIAPWRSSNSLA
jgi:hypothetical protein